MSRPVRFSSYSMFIDTKRQGEDRYEWCVFVDEPAALLDEIESVEYTLHPTFPNPIRLVNDRDHRFALYSSGWGSFALRIRVSFINGEHTTTSFYLELAHDGWPRKAPGLLAAGSAMEKVYNVLADSDYRWRKLSTIIRRTGLEKANVLHALSDLESTNLARKAFFQSLSNEDLWGATSVVGVAP